ncbi:hypothetical protein DEU56DRAFT_781339 [Suillus clintonianus]|uniref:uncharacterized protein n=1 Tax=Suillus clintonianus TaxID=1904413 RepID=UPI001B880C23|nr:uncharacterized protein DEU56DRAFT_781339 [Suillus clintonianus]KAG2149259.1 hypothetical protein DEU56DRAFT_781339 [Suillus clintonianus]
MKIILIIQAFILVVLQIVYHSTVLVKERKQGVKLSRKTATELTVLHIHKRDAKVYQPFHGVAACSSACSYLRVMLPAISQQSNKNVSTTMPIV